MLQRDPKNRITAIDAVQHPYFGSSASYIFKTPFTSAYKETMKD